MGHRDTRIPPEPTSLRSLCANAGVCQVDGRPVQDVRINGLTNDSRAVSGGSCFVAVKGQAVDGHAFLAQAIQAGAAAAVVNAAAPVPCSDAVAVVRVADTREAASRLAAVSYGVQRGGPRALRLVGVTGTNGKSTVAWLIRAILQAAGQRCALLGTIEYDLGGLSKRSDLTTPDPIKLCEMLALSHAAGAGVGVLEVSSHALEQRRCDGLTFDVAIFTNLSGDHLDYHSSMDAYFVAKVRLFSLCDDHSTALLNVDDNYGRRLLSTINTPCISYAVDAPDARARATINTVSRTGGEIALDLETARIEVTLPLVGRYNVTNALAAALACESLGVDHGTIRRGLESVTGVPGRLQRVEPDDCPFSVFVDYAHTDAALTNVLQAVRPITTGRLTCVFGCGGDRDHTKRPRMGAAVEQHADVAVVTSDNPRSEDPIEIMEQIKAGFGARPSCTVHVDADRRAAIAWAIAQSEPGDTVLIAGKGHEDYQILGDRRIHFDDAEVARDLLAATCGPEVSA